MVKNYKRKICLQIDMLMPIDTNILVKECNKLSKYKDMEIKIEKVWSSKTTTVPVIVGAQNMIKEETDKH